MKYTGLTRQKGSIALTAALTLLAGMTALVFFTNRSLIFEQKTSASHTRSTKAMEAAEAGLEWALANLNYSTKIGAACTALTSPASTDKIFRDRYLDPDGNGSYSETFSTITPGCVNTGSGALTCSCPTSGNPSFGSSTGPTFTVTLRQVTGQSMMAEIVSVGCSSPDLPCVASSSTTADSTATVRQIVKIQSALATPPAAPLTAARNVSLSSNAITITNTDPATNGITINAGGTISTHSTNNIQTVPGTPANASLVDGDASLVEATLFQTFFGQSKETFKAAATTKQITCPGNCNSTVSAAVDGGARVIWVNGAMDLNSNLVVGSASSPVILVVDGDAHLSGTVVIYGVLYCTADVWDNTGGGNATLFGAAIAERDFTATGTPNPTYDPDVLSKLNTSTGQFSRVPGSWRDF